MELVTLWMVIKTVTSSVLEAFLRDIHVGVVPVIANDSVQTLGTWIASNNERFNWKELVTLWGKQLRRFFSILCGMGGLLTEVTLVTVV